MSQENKLLQQQVNIELPPEQAEGTYANLAIINHSGAEFVLDFSRLLPGIPRAKVYSRIIMTPQHAKSLLKALEDNIDKYEQQFGEIKLKGLNDPGRSFGFQSTSKDK